MASYLSADNGLMISFENKEFPTGLRTSNTITWTPITTMTAWAPILGFSASGPFTVNLTIQFSIEEGPVMPRVKNCRSLSVPTYGPYRPPIVTLELESYIVGFIGVVTAYGDSVDATYGWVKNDPASAIVTLTLEECSDKPLTSVYGYSGSGGSSGPTIIST